MARQTFYGVALSVHIEDETAANWYEHDWPVMPEIDILRSGRLGSGARVFNIGAHQAVVAMVLGSVVGPSGSVIALEADKHSAEVGAKNVRLNGMQHVNVIHGAGDCVSGELFFTDEYHVARPKDVVTHRTAAFSVDDLAQRYGWPDVIFVDVEGYECKVLEGARKSLNAGADCLIEVHVGVGLELFGGSVDKILEYFPSDRFRVLVADTADPVFAPIGTSPAIARRHFYCAAMSR